jgi:hypothetical protein
MIRGVRRHPPAELPEELQIERSLPHGHVAAALGMIRKITLDRLILRTAKDAKAQRSL